MQNRNATQANYTVERLDKKVLSVLSRVGNIPKRKEKDMTKTLTTGTTYKTLNNRISGLIKSNKHFQTTLQKVLEDFILLYIDGTLSRDTTGMERLLLALRKTDRTLVMEYFKRVTTGYWTTNKNGSLVIRLQDGQEAFKTTKDFETLNWYDLAEKSKTTVNDHFETESKAIESFENYFKKVMKSNFDKSQMTKILTKITEKFSEQL